METDVSSGGIGAVLMQEGNPIAFLSRALKGKELQLSAYERELLVVVMVVQRWHQYLTMRPFIIRTDQQSLKHLLNHKTSTTFQLKWLPKLAGLDYSVEYKRGADNKAIDALSRITGVEL